MSSCQEKIVWHIQKANKIKQNKPQQLGGIKKTSVPDIAGILELSDLWFKTTMIIMIKSVMDKVNKWAI